MESRSRQSLFDPDLDTPRRRQSHISSELIENQRRLIVNPFLAVLGWVIALAVIRIALLSHHLVLFLTGLGLSLVPLFLFQYHCLDCGATGWLQSAWRHGCPAVVARAENGVVRRFPGMSLGRQVMAWISILAVAFMVFVIVRLARV